MQPLYVSGFEAVSAEVASRLHPDGVPQWLKTGSDTIVICLHGFTGMPYEAKPIAEACAAAGLDASTLALPGHGYQESAYQWRQFSNITVEGMLTAVRQDICKARKQYQHVVMFGHSMGGAIALLMASEGLLDACAVTAPALRLPLLAELLVPWLGWINLKIATHKETQFYLPAYHHYSGKAVRVLWQLGRLAKRELPKITCPVLAIHSHNDHTIPWITTQWVQERVHGPVKVVWFDLSDHCLPLDVDGQAVADTVAQFCAQG